MKLNHETKALYKYLINFLMSYFIKSIENQKHLGIYSLKIFAEDIKQDLDNYNLAFLINFVPLDDLIDIHEKGRPLEKIGRICVNIRYHCFEYHHGSTRPGDGYYTKRTLEEQNEFAKTRYHYDYSLKKPKTFKEL